MPKEDFKVKDKVMMRSPGLIKMTSMFKKFGWIGLKKNDTNIVINLYERKIIGKVVDKYEKEDLEYYLVEWMDFMGYHHQYNIPKTWLRKVR